MYPRTHTSAFHSELAACGPVALLRSRRGVAMTLHAGDAVLMDSRLYHHGGANTSGRRRCLLVVSFATREASPKGSTYSLLPHLQGRYTLDLIRQASRRVAGGPEAAAGAEAAEEAAEVAAEEAAEEAPSRTLEAEEAPSRAHAEAPEEAEPAMLLLPLPLAQQMLGMALVGLPKDEPRAEQCRQVLSAAVRDAVPTTKGKTIDDDDADGASASAGSAEGAGAGAGEHPGARFSAEIALVRVPLALILAFQSFRVLGPHLRASSRFGALQRCIDAQVHAIAAVRCAPLAHKYGVRIPVAATAPETESAKAAVTAPGVARFGGQKTRAICLVSAVALLALVATVSLAGVDDLHAMAFGEGTATRRLVTNSEWYNRLESGALVVAVAGACTLTGRGLKLRRSEERKMK